MSNKPMTKNAGGGVARPTRLKVTRVKKRVYDGRYSPRRLTAHAEYAIVADGKAVAHLVSGNGRTWVVVEGHSETKFGLVVSPMNLRLIRDLKEWAMQKWNSG